MASMDIIEQELTENSCLAKIYKPPRASRKKSKNNYKPRVSRKRVVKGKTNDRKAVTKGKHEAKQENKSEKTEKMENNNSIDNNKVDNTEKLEKSVASESPESLSSSDKVRKNETKEPITLNNEQHHTP